MVCRDADVKRERSVGGVFFFMGHLALWNGIIPHGFLYFPLGIFYNPHEAIRDP